MNENLVHVNGVDLFCGGGGLTRGLEDAGINMAVGVDIDQDCEYPYTANSKAGFLKKSVEDVTAEDLSGAFAGRGFRLLAGCAPCQPFSAYNHRKAGNDDKRRDLLSHFDRLVKEVKPELVAMENVPGIKKERVFLNFIASLQAEGFHVSYQVVNCADYGVPQRRRRLILLASRLGPIELIEPTTPGDRQITVREAIGDMPPLEAGDVCDADPLHQAARMSPLNLKRIRASKPGGTWRDWDEELIAACHKKYTGKSYLNTYGRMTWDKPSPTLTTKFHGYGNGCFGHPEQDRGISLREGAILQSFPPDYKFERDGAPIRKKTVARIIGNAVPVKIGEAIGRSIIEHIRTTGEILA